MHCTLVATQLLIRCVFASSHRCNPTLFAAYSLVPFRVLSCFMSVVVQSLLHNPLLRTFFLSDKHNRHRCARRAKAIANIAANTGSSASQVCLACDVDDLFSAFYSGDHSAALPDHFLLSVWNHAEHLAGYAQQDAHEMLMGILDGIHDGCKNNMDAEAAAAAAATSASSSSSSGPASALPRPSSPCRCIVHSVFGGTLRSDVRCNTCGTISTALDAMLDLSLDIVMNAPTAGSGMVTPTAASAAAAAGPKPPLSLLSCLSRFTRLEKLFNDDKFFCGKCNSAEDSTKQMSLHTMPLTLCLHLKRFDHGGGGVGPGFGGGGNGGGSGSGSSSSGAGSKIDAYVSFPLRDLDLSPYLHSELLSPLSPAVGPRNVGASTSGGSNDGTSRSASASASSSLARSRLYDVFCVIVHKGSLDTGHYLCYLRIPLAPDDPDPRQWLRADDRTVVRVEEREVQMANASVEQQQARCKPGCVESVHCSHAVLTLCPRCVTLLRQLFAVLHSPAAAGRNLSLSANAFCCLWLCATLQI